MTLVALVARLAVVVSAMVAVGAFAVVGRHRLRRARVDYRARARTVAPYLALLGVVLAVNNAARRLAPEVSWMIGWNVTGLIYAFEGTLVAHVQAFATPPVTAYLSFVYVYGYVFLLVFPLIAYFALPDPEPIRVATLAYTVNYAVGLLCYVLFIAYGPRNLMPELVGSLLYTHWPESHVLTSQVNTNSNVFPSLHTSLSATVAILAYRTRDVYPRWLPVAVLFAASVVVSTMYLGIHWLADVLAGALLAVVSVAVASRVRGLWTPILRWAALDGRVVARLRGVRATLGRWVHARR